MREALTNANIDLVTFFDIEYRRIRNLDALARKHAIKAELLSRLLKQGGRNIQKGNHSRLVSINELKELYERHEGNVSAISIELKMDRTTVKKKLHNAGLIQKRSTTK